MKVPSRTIAVCLLFVSVGGSSLFGAEEPIPDPVPPANRPDREALRERARNMSPEERQKALREFRERHGLGGTNRSELEKRREELKNLPPAEREARLKELRETFGPARREFRMNREQRETKRSEMKERIDGQISALEQKKAEAALTETEQRRLDRMRQMSKRLTQNIPPPALGLPPPAKPSNPAAVPDKTKP
jgi:hypothetical protein